MCNVHTVISIEIIMILFNYILIQAMKIIIANSRCAARLSGLSVYSTPYYKKCQIFIIIMRKTLRRILLLIHIIVYILKNGKIEQIV